MSVQELKAIAHRRIDEAENEELLEEVVRILNADDSEVQEPGMLYFTEEGKRQLSKAENEIKEGKFSTLEEAQVYFDKRFNKE